MKTIVIGAGCDLGVHIDGAHLGAAQLLNDLQSFYKGESITLKQDETVIKSRNLSDRCKNEYDLEKFNTNLYNSIIAKNQEEYFPVVVGGDHSVAIASALATQKTHNDIGLIWFSGHTNYSNFTSTVTGNISDFALSAVSSNKNQELRAFHNGQVIQPAKVVVVGAREIPKHEKDDIKYSGITVFTMDDINQKGLENVLDEAFEIVNFKTQGFHVSFSLDIIDPEFAPGVSSPVDDGLTEEEAMKINEYIIKNIKNVVAYDLVEFNPLRDQNRKTEQIGVNLLAQVLHSLEKKDKYKEIK